MTPREPFAEPPGGSAPHPCLLEPAGDPNTPYALAEFLEDQRRISVTTGHRDPSGPDRLRDLEGNLCRVCVSDLHEALEMPALARAFARYYPREIAGAHLWRFALVVDFLRGQGERIVRLGLGRELGESLAVREELVRFLLDVHVEPPVRALPAAVLDRFVDEWGHRWF